eukprot:356856-Chlamydomonas_euryale.AAC.2
MLGSRCHAQHAVCGCLCHAQHAVCGCRCHAHHAVCGCLCHAQYAVCGCLCTSPPKKARKALSGFRKRRGTADAMLTSRPYKTKTIASQQFPTVLDVAG